MATQAEVLPVVAPAENVPGPAQGHWTYDEYAKLPGEGRLYQIVAGVLYMTPAPNLNHQDVCGNIFHFLREHVKMGGLGKVFPAPTDVELAPGTVVQPDVVVVLKANAEVMHPSRIIGAPDIVVEVASPSTATHDRHTKFQAYARAGVREYWIAEPDAKTVELLELDEKRESYNTKGVYRGGAALPSSVLPDFATPVENFFF